MDARKQRPAGHLWITYEEAHSIEVEHAVRNGLPVPTYAETVERMQALEREGRDYTLPPSAPRRRKRKLTAPD